MAGGKSKASASAEWHRPLLATVVGLFMWGYFLALLVLRYNLRGIAGVYDLMWACNVALLLAGYGMLVKDAAIIAGSVGLIAMAHALWQVDVILYLAFGFWPVGLASYLVWPQTSAVEIVSTLHHVWFIPLCYMVLYKNGTMDLKAWRYSLVFGFAVLVMSYLLTPMTYDGYYLNVNLAHGFWKDVQVDALHQFNPPETHWLLYLAFVYAVTLPVNSTLFFFWRIVQRIFWGHHTADKAKQA